MKLFVRSVPAILVLSAAALSLIALAGCGSSGGGSNNPSGGNNPSGPAAAKSIYAIQNASNNGTEQDSMLVFSASATGNTTPTSILDLPSGFFSESLAVGPQGQIYVGRIPDDGESNSGQILEYAAGSTGSATPTVTLNGSDTDTTTFDYPIALAVNSAGTLVVSSSDGTLESFASGFTASSAPTQYLTWGHDNFSDEGRPIGVDTAGDIFYADRRAIDVFAAGATGAAAPAHAITGTDTTTFDTTYDELDAMAVDGAGDVYVANHNSITGDDPTPEPTGIIEFAAGGSGNATPLKRIGGSATNIVEPDALAVDAVGNLYYADANGDWLPNNDMPLLLEVFSASASGNVAPAASISSTDFTTFDSHAVALH
jgi:hypothetical protein